MLFLISPGLVHFHASCLDLFGHTVNEPDLAPTIIELISRTFLPVLVPFSPVVIIYIVFKKISRSRLVGGFEIAFNFNLFHFLFLCLSSFSSAVFVLKSNFVFSESESSVSWRFSAYSFFCFSNAILKRDNPKDGTFQKLPPLRLMRWPRSDLRSSPLIASHSCVLFSSAFFHLRFGNSSYCTRTCSLTSLLSLQRVWLKSSNDVFHLLFFSGRQLPQFAGCEQNPPFFLWLIYICAFTSLMCVCVSNLWVKRRWCFWRRLRCHYLLAQHRLGLHRFNLAWFG